MAEFYPLLFGRGFSLPQLLFFLLLLLTLVQGPSTGPLQVFLIRVAQSLSFTIVLSIAVLIINLLTVQ